MLSLGDDTVAVLDKVVAAAGAVTTIVIVAVPRAASEAIVQVVVVVPLQVQPAAVRLTKVARRGWCRKR
jgi:hypothetical protein